MKSLEEKRDEACINYVGFGYGCDGDTSADSFKAGWDACAKEYEQENAELKRLIANANEVAERDGKDYSELLVKKRILEQELEDKNRALTEIIKEETNNQRPGGTYSRSYLIAYYAMKAYQPSGVSSQFILKSYVEHDDDKPIGIFNGDL